MMSSPMLIHTQREPRTRNDREVFRVAYPTTYPIRCAPHLLVDGEALAVPLLDCSEHGIRFAINAWDSPVIGALVQGTLRIRDGTTRRVTGAIVRTEPDQVAVLLDRPGLAFSLVIAEERAVRLWTRTKVGAEHRRPARERDE